MSNNNSHFNQTNNLNPIHRLYDSGMLRVVIFAGVVIVFSMLLVGTIVYLLTEGEVVDKLKSKDLVYIAQSIASKIDGRIERAKETSLSLARDPEIKRWVAGGEQDAQLKNDALEKIGMMVKDLDYSNSFIVSTVTGHYWAENGEILNTMSETNPADAWFYRRLDINEAITVDIDYNAQRKDTFVFVNALMGDLAKPLAVIGVGLSMKEMSKHFESYKYGENSNLWLIDASGDIYLSDWFDHNGQNIKSLLPIEAADQVLRNMKHENQVIEFRNSRGELTDLISYPLKSTNWRLVFQIPRSETVSFLTTIKMNTAIAVCVALVSVVFFFVYISRKLANPYKRALQLNFQLEKQIAIRTKELVQQNEKIMDSINYAKRIQQSILPDSRQLEQLFKEHFVIWKPRDIVGGDFYWVKKFKDGVLVAVGDCTGHGVPGAFMTMLTVSILNQLAEQQNSHDPSLLLSQLNRIIKRTLHQESKEGLTDDGLDIGLCYLSENRLVFAGAGMSLYVCTPDGLRVIKGGRKRIGYHGTPSDHVPLSQELEAGSDSVIYMTTDGLFDQNGGPKDYSFGRSRFLKLIEAYSRMPLAEQKNGFEVELSKYMGEETQRDDITVLAFRWDKI